MNPPLPADQPWYYSLPPVLLLPDTWLTFILAFAFFGWLKSLPLPNGKWFAAVPPVGTMISAVGLACGLHVGGSTVYSIGTGMISGSFACHFYSYADEWLTSFVKKWTGTTAVPVVLATFLTSGCIALAGAAMAVMPFIDAVTPLVTLAAKQTALNVAQKFATGQPVTTAQVADQLVAEVRPVPGPTQVAMVSQALANAITAVQSQTPGSPAKVKTEVSAAITQAQTSPALAH